MWVLMLMWSRAFSFYYLVYLMILIEFLETGFIVLQPCSGMTKYVTMYLLVSTVEAALSQGLVVFLRLHRFTAHGYTLSTHSPDQFIQTFKYLKTIKNLGFSFKIKFSFFACCVSVQCVQKGRELSRVAAKRQQLLESVQSGANALQQEAMNVKPR